MRFPWRLDSVVLAIAVLATAPTASTSAEQPETGIPAVKRPAPTIYQIGGHCDCIAAYARPSNTCDYDGYRVGGGVVHGSTPFPSDGTWGWDYFGAVLSRRIDLGWSHGDRYQAGQGAYRADGPRPH